MNTALALLLLAIGVAAETRPRQAFSFKRTAATKAPKHGLKAKANHTYGEHEIEVWYINQGKREDRKNCIEGQLMHMGITPHRFEALEPTKEDLKEGGKYHDCVKGGLLKNAAYIDATAGGISSGDHTKRAIIGNTCSHKRLFEQLAKSKSTAKYFVVLEDDAILNPLKFKTALNQFVDENWGYKGKFAQDFQMVQLDFIGSFCMGHQVGRFGGKRVFKPKDIYKPGYGGADCSRYFGAQALLMQKDTLNEVVDNMESNPTAPMDWVQGQLPKALAWRPQIARSPIQKFNKLPDFCSKNIRTSSISFKREANTFTKKDDTPVKKVDTAFKKFERKPQYDMNQWMDAFRMETKADDASDDVKADEE